MESETYKFACPHCGQHLEAEPDWAGMECECPGCGKALTVPQPAGGRLSPAAAEQDATPDTAHEDTRPPASPAPPVITVVQDKAAQPPIITVVKHRDGFFARNRKWLIPVAGGAAALLLIVGLVAVKHKHRRESGNLATTASPTSTSYAATTPTLTPHERKAIGGMSASGLCKEFVQFKTDFKYTQVDDHTVIWDPGGENPPMVCAAVFEDNGTLTVTQDNTFFALEYKGVSGYAVARKLEQAFPLANQYGADIKNIHDVSATLKDGHLYFQGKISVSPGEVYQKFSNLFSAMNNTRGWLRFNDSQYRSPYDSF